MSENRSSHHSSRRVFLRNATVASLGTLGAFTASSCANEVTEESTEPEVFSGVLTPVLAESELSPGESARKLINDTELLIFRESTDLVHAYSAICPHEGCVVDIIPHGAEDLFQCPCHSSRFDQLTGDVLGGPAPRGLTRHPAEISDGQILVEL